MYTLESLSVINLTYCYSHSMTQKDVDTVNSLVETIEKERVGVTTPLPGDIVYFTDRYGQYYDNALPSKLNAFGDGKAEVCYGPYAPVVSMDGGEIRLSVSGGPFGHHDPAAFAFMGESCRRFAVWGACGPQANGLVEFDARVHLWSYREPNPLYGDYSTKDWDMFYVNYSNEPKDGSRYRYSVSLPGGTRMHAFADDTAYLAWLKTYRGIEFNGAWENQTVVFCYKKVEKLISQKEWDALALPTDTRFINCSTILVKVDYDDFKHVVKEYRYENKGTLNSNPYRISLEELEKDTVRRVILPRTAE